MSIEENKTNLQFNKIKLKTKKTNKILNFP